MKLFCVLLAIFVFASCSVNKASLDNDVMKDMDGFIASNQISGAVTLAIHNGEILNNSVVGMADIDGKIPMQKDSLFRIASLTKNVTAVGVMILQERGVLNVNDSVSKYLPEFKDVKLKKDDGKGPVDLKIYHLMSHTSGVNIPAEASKEMWDLDKLSKAIAK